MSEFLKSSILEFKGPHEIHVTTDPASTDDDSFQKVCAELGVKAHVIYNETPAGETITDYLTGSEYACTTIQALQELGRIASGLRRAGLDIVREKIETSPWHPGAPRFGERSKPGTYFESHFTLPDLPTMHGERVLAWKGVPLLLSTTDNKRQGGQLFATLRHYESNSEEFPQIITDLHNALIAQFPVEFPTIEFAVYDSNPSHDKKWVDSYKAPQFH